MFRRSFLTISFFLFILTVIISCSQTEKKTSKSADTDKKENINLKPFKVLVVIGDQWTDPMSYSIDPTRVKDEDFLDVVTMLKIWGIPFDILRLDEQRLQINRFLDGEAKPNYGCIIWMANPDVLKGYSANYETLARAVNEYGISIIALTDYIKNGAIADLMGLKFTKANAVNLGDATNKFVVSGSHFITSRTADLILPDKKQLAGSSIPEANGITISDTTLKDITETINLVSCTPSESVLVLAKIGDAPQLTVKDISKDTKAIWIGGGHDWFRKYPSMRKILRQSLVYSIGYGIFNDNFENGFICIMDDVGCAEHSYSLMWHYPTPAKDTLIKYLIEPLEKYGFMMVQNITPGFANPKTRMIELSWNIPPFKDIFGNWQDYGSTKQGLDEGLRRGVFEIQPHRAWSHMNWDLESPPGPFWGKPEGEMRNTDWYNEVVDVRRDNQPVPSNDLLFIYKMGIDAIIKSFGVVPLAAEVRPGAELRKGKPGGFDNGRIAAIAGLGVSRECYVGFDHTIEFRMMMPEQFTFHDLDLTAKTNYKSDQPESGWDILTRMPAEELLACKIAGGRRLNVHDSQDWIESRKNRKWMGFNETCAYLHSLISGPGNEGFKIEFNYDDHYCRYFEKKSSKWTLELSDGLMEKLGNNISVMVDGRKTNTAPGASQIIEIPAGLGSHKVELN